MISRRSKVPRTERPGTGWRCRVSMASRYAAVNAASWGDGEGVRTRTAGWQGERGESAIPRRRAQARTRGGGRAHRPASRRGQAPRWHGNAGSFSAATVRYQAAASELLARGARTQSNPLAPLVGGGMGRESSCKLVSRPTFTSMRKPMPPTAADRVSRVRSKGRMGARPRFT